MFVLVLLLSPGPGRRLRTALALCLVAVTASAQDRQAGVLISTATPVAAGEGEASMALGHFGALTTGGVGTAVRAGIAPADRLWVEVAAVGTGMLYKDNDVGNDLLGIASTTVQYNVVETETFAFAPTVSAGWVQSGTKRNDGGAFLGAVGFSTSGMVGRTRLDGGLVIGFIPETTMAPILPVLPLFDIGAAFPLGPTDHHSLRAGLTGTIIPAPDLSYRYEKKDWFFESGFTGVPGVAGITRAEVGVRW